MDKVYKTMNGRRTYCEIHFIKIMRREPGIMDIATIDSCDVCLEEQKLKVKCRNLPGRVCSPDYDGFGECGDYMGFTLEEAKNNYPWAEELRED